MKHLLAFFISTSFLVNSAFAQLITKQPVPDTVCETDTAVFSVVVVDSTILQWQYSNNSNAGPWDTVPLNGFIGAHTNTLKVTQPGMYNGDYFRVLVMDTATTPSNEFSDSVLLTVNPNPTVVLVSMPGGFAFCEGGSIVLQTMVSYSTYQWGPMGQMTPTINVMSGGPYTVTVTDVNQCKGSSAHQVIENPKPTVPSIGPMNKEFCKGGSLLLMGNSGYMDYKWSTGGNGSSVLVSSAGTYTLTVTDYNGCSNIGVAVVTENALPNSAFTSSPIIIDSIQAGKKIKFTDTSTPGMGSIIETWIWNFGQGSNPMEKMDSVANNMTNVYFLKTGTTIVCLETVNQKSCHDTYCDSFQVTPGIGPIVTLELLNQPRCLGDVFCIVVTATNQSPINDSLSQEIEYGYNLNFLELISITHAIKNNNIVRDTACFKFKKIGEANIIATAYQYDLSAQDPPLEGSGSKMVTSGTEIPQITHANIPAFLCRGENAKIIFSIEPAKNGFIMYSINNEPFIALINLGKAEILISTDNFSVNYVDLAVFEIETDGCRSELDISWSIEIRPLPEIEIAGLDTVCIGEIAWLVASGANSNSYSWKINNIQPPFSTNDSLKIKSDLPGLYKYTVVGTLNECSDRDSTIVLVAGTPTPEIFGNSVVCVNQVVGYFSHDTLPNHVWTVTGGSVISQDLDSVHIQWKSEGQWDLILTQNIGKCRGDDTLQITVSNNNSPPFDSLVWLKGGRILLYPNPDNIEGLCYQWYFMGDSIPGEKFQGYVVPVGDDEKQLSIRVWYCADGKDCSQLIHNRSTDFPPEETEPRFQVLPNPNSGAFDVKYDGLKPGHYIQHIIGTTGKILYEQELDIAGSSGTQPVYVHDLIAAAYFVRWVNTTTGSVLITQIVVLP